MSDATPPVRPANVPATAQYDPENSEGFRWQEVGRDEDGKKHGPSRTWTDTGYLHSEGTYVHGELDGANTVFHPDGSVSSIGYREGGKTLDCVFHRAKPGVESPEFFPADAGSNVMTVRFCSRDGVSNYAVRYFDADGAEVCDTGAPMPPRPAGVSEDAYFFPTRNRWMQGSIKRGAGKLVGTSKHWTAEGKLLMHEELDAGGNRLSLVKYHEDTGALSQSETHENGVCRVEKSYFSNGRLHFEREQDAQGKMTHEVRVQGGVKFERRASWDERGLVDFVETRDGTRAFEAKRENDQLILRSYEKDVLVVEATSEGERLVSARTFDQSGAVRSDVRFPQPPALRRALKRLDGDSLAQIISNALITQLADSVGDVAALDGVTKVPWDQTEGASGTVDNFAILLKTLASPETFVHGTALGTIEAAIEHQGTVYAATAASMPFLIRLLTAESAPRADLLQTINRCARAAVTYYGKAREAEQANELEDWHRDVLGTLRALDREATVLKATFERATLDEKRCIIDILGHARGSTAFDSVAHDELESVARSSPDASIRATAVHALFPLKKAPTLLWTTSDADPLVRTVAAIQLGLRLGPESPPETIDLLRTALDTRAELAPRMTQLPFVKCGYVATVMRGLWAIRVPAVFALAPSLCSELEKMDPVSAVIFGQDLLGMAFGECELPFMPGFVDVLAALASSTKFFTFNVNASEALGMFGLPRDQEGLTALVTRLRNEPDPAAAMYAVMHP